MSLFAKNYLILNLKGCTIFCRSLYVNYDVIVTVIVVYCFFFYVDVVDLMMVT